MDQITKIHDITSIVIIDKDLKVLKHTKHEEWGKTYNNVIFKKAIDSQQPLMQRATTFNGYIYSTPLPNDLTMCIQISNLESINLYHLILKKSFFIFCIILSIIITSTFLLLRKEFKEPFLKLYNILESVAIGGGKKINIEKNDEFGHAYSFINKIIERLEQKTTTENTNTNIVEKTNLMGFVNGFSNCFDFGIIVLNNEHKIVSVNNKGIEFLKTTTYLNEHIVDVIKYPDLLKPLQKSISNINNFIEEKINTNHVKYITIGKDDCINGIIMMIK
jgi:methyl-accepting chemotaxis protein